MATKLKKVSLGKLDLWFIFKPISQARCEDLRSQLEIKQDDLIEAIEKIDSHSCHAICESGWSFNDPEKLSKEFPYFRLYYFILSPSPGIARKRYLEKHPNSKKDINKDSDWVGLESGIIKPKPKAKENLKEKLNPKKMGYIEFNDQELEAKVRKAKEILIAEPNPTIFIIVGPNASGKSTLFCELMKEFKLLEKK